MRILILICVAFLSLQIFAQDFQADPLSMSGQGSLISLRLVPGEGRAKLFFVGHEALRLNFEKDLKLIEVTAMQNDKVKEQLMFEPDRGYYTIKKLPDWQSPYELRVKAKVNGSDQILNLKVKP